MAIHVNFKNLKQVETEQQLKNLKSITKEFDWLDNSRDANWIYEVYKPKEDRYAKLLKAAAEILSGRLFKLEAYAPINLATASNSLGVALPEHLQELKDQYESSKDPSVLVKFILALKKYKSSIQRAAKILIAILKSKSRPLNTIDMRAIIFKNRNSNVNVHLGNSEDEIKENTFFQRVLFFTTNLLSNEKLRIYNHIRKNNRVKSFMFN